MLSTGIIDKADLHPNFLISKMRKYCFLYYDCQNKKQNYISTRISVAPVTLLPTYRFLFSRRIFIKHGNGHGHGYALVCFLPWLCYMIRTFQYKQLGYSRTE